MSDPAWYEWLTSGTSLTRIAYVQESGDVYFPEGEGPNDQSDFILAMARGRAWLLVRADKAIADIVAERERQDVKWGPQDHPNGTGPDSTPMFAPTATGIADDDEAHYIRDVMQGRTSIRFSSRGDRPGTWSDILLEEVFEALAEEDSEKLRAELIQSAAVAAAWALAIDKRMLGGRNV